MGFPLYTPVCRLQLMFILPVLVSLSWVKLLARDRAVEWRQTWTCFLPDSSSNKNWWSVKVQAHRNFWGDHYLSRDVINSNKKMILCVCVCTQKGWTLKQKFVVGNLGSKSDWARVPRGTNYKTGKCFLRRKLPWLSDATHGAPDTS